MSPELLWKLGRVGGGSLSPNGEHAAYTVRRYELSENAGKSGIRVVELKTGRDTLVLGDLKSASGLQWAETARGVHLYFVTSRGNGDDVTPQAWSMRVDGKDLRQITNVEGGIANLKVSPTGKHIAFTANVKLDKTVNELDIAKDLPKADARIIDSLFYRHWSAWHDYKFTHLHVAELSGKGVAGEARDLMEGVRADCPVPPFAGSEHFNWSPDGREIAFTMKNVRNWAESTNSDVYTVGIDEGARTVTITTGMNGYDNEPVYSPDGRFLAFHSMERPSFESDRNRVMLYDRQNGEIVDVTHGLDQTAHGATWLPDSSALLFVSEFRGTNQIFRVKPGEPGAQQITSGRYNWSLRDIAADGETLLVARSSMIRPYELLTLSSTGGEAKVITKTNDEIYAGLEVPTIEERWVRASDGKSIHNWVIYPPNFDPKKKWPMLTYCQGGPQGQIGQWFSYRWNFHLMAAQGYVVLAVNRRGLPGFGREWNDQISRDWGGQAMQDILSATDDMLTESYVDRERVGAIGASFGGYTVFWLMGNSDDRFATMIAHCGVFNLESMYGSTEELFFVNWDLGGPYWKSAEIARDYERFSPHEFVRNWRTPLLVIHGEKDFRVPVTQGMEAFTAAQVQGVPSRFLYFPEEGHWVLTPQNGVLWHRVFFDWLGRSCKPRSN